MPDLDTSMHLDMLAASPSRGSRSKRVLRAIKRAWPRPLYGMEWSDPKVVPPLAYFREQYVDPYVRADHIGLEIGAGGGRWTQYLLGFRRLYVVDYHAELLAELRKNFAQPTIVPVKNNGTDFPGVEPASVDYVFSFGVFVHLEQQLIEAYLNNLVDVVKPYANIVIQYSDKTKIMAQENEAFADNTPERMREMVQQAGYTVVEEDLTSLWHSSVIRFTPTLGGA